MKSRKISAGLASAVLAVMFAIGGLFVSAEANASPLAAMKGAITEAAPEDVTLVRDGCGRGMRFSNSRQRCVEDFRGGGQRVIVVPRGCPRGTRFSDRRQACVPVGGGVDPAAAIIGGVVQGIISSGAPRGRGCGPGLRWSDRRGACVPR
jgi:hypothetical protein